MIGVTPGFEAMALSLCQSLAQSGPVSVDDFDDEWSPAGENYRDELVSGGFVSITEPTTDEQGHPLIVLTGAGVALARGEGANAPVVVPQP
jgi:hypothetical protein